SYDNSALAISFTVQSSGTGSRIDLSGLTDFVANTFSSTTVNATSGGRIDLSGTISGRVFLNLSGTTSTFAVGGITTLTGLNVTVSNNGIVTFPNVTSLMRTNLG